MTTKESEIFGGRLMTLIFMVGLFFALCGITMGLWNTSLMNGFQLGWLRTITFMDAIGITAFIVLVFGAPAIGHLASYYWYGRAAIPL